MLPTATVKFVVRIVNLKGLSVVENTDLQINGLSYASPYYNSEFLRKFSGLLGFRCILYRHQQKLLEYNDFVSARERVKY